MFKLKPVDPLVAAISLALLGSAGAALAVDSGDAPSTYGPAVHEIPPQPPQLGVIAPDDDTATPGEGANSDDNDGVDDEDGVFEFPTLVQNGKSYTTNVFASNPTNEVANVVGWIDFNGDGVFSADEAAIATVPPGADNVKVKLVWPNLEGVTTDFTGETYARFRISTQVITPFDATGTLPDGEVEDYPLFIESDVDGDEIPDVSDTDNDNDGIPDLVEGLDVDNDSDGIADYLDEDSDNDMIPDAIEAGSDPSNPVDTDGDGIPDFRDVDSNNDGTLDSELVTGDADGDGLTGAEEGIGDADGDGVINAFDVDSDNDTLLDSFETDADNDGDGVPNYLDLDSDNDGIPDIREASVSGVDVDALDTDGDGRVDAGNVHGQNGLVDVVETDVDSGELIFNVADSDADGLVDVVDIDSDNDSISDLTEAGGVDSDNNSSVDSLTDSDGDTVVDSVDIDFVAGGQDSDLDQIVDSADVSFSDGEDTDLDGIIDSADPDADGNGFVDQPVNIDTTGGVFPDTDGDGIPDHQDAIDGANPDETNGNGPNNGTGGIGNGGSNNGGNNGNGIVETGLNGIAGCVIGNGRTAFDPLLAVLALFAAGVLGLKRKSRQVRSLVPVKRERDLKKRYER